MRAKVVVRLTVLATLLLTLTGLISIGGHLRPSQRSAVLTSWADPSTAQPRWGEATPEAVSSKATPPPRPVPGFAGLIERRGATASALDSTAS